MVSGGHVEACCGFVEGPFGLGGRDMADRSQKASMVEPVDPFEGLPFDGAGGPPRRAAVDDLRVEQADDRLREGVVVAVPCGADGRRDARVGEPLGVAQRQILRPAVGMRDQFRVMGRSALVQGLFEGIEDEPGLP